MSLQQHFDLLARYNQWMNGQLYAAAEKLSPEALAQDRGAFFRSILGTLNHLVVADTVWLQRFACHPESARSLQPACELPRPASLEQLLFNDFDQLCAHRQWLDALICQWVSSLQERDLDHVLSYQNMKGQPAQRRLSSLLLHFFNHQTHHRGQATTLLFQAGLDVGVTDLLALIPDEAEA
ncbi:DinB family protein [Pseudomonas sp. LPB0260]|uniref:DinB family protein n=1 Tax=Pseudomonas sp. LPB0260 TaxID=2614442 RepID=UPI0015C29D5B|nr:DinB family protein [Pseudomonas sp. LPB0260]QLC72203.1 DinB family protein [Pseudomonas sp. LPB0260]QLC74981.1 DinB family protein [Pseudomonas sp. LPB0260]